MLVTVSVVFQVSSVASRLENTEQKKKDRLMTERTAYDILGIESDALPDIIRSSYLKLARKYHPDKSKDEAAEVRSKRNEDSTLKNDILQNNRACFEMFRRLGIH